jgi:hypothetical protein
VFAADSLQMQQKELMQQNRLRRDLLSPADSLQMQVAE